MAGSGGEAGFVSGDLTLPVVDVERLISAVIYGFKSRGSTEARVRAVFARVSPLFGDDTEFQIHMGIRLDRDPVPLLLDRMWYGTIYDEIEPRPTTLFQKTMDEYAFALKMRVQRIRASPEVPFSNTIAELIGQERAEEVRERILRPAGFEDVLLSDWMSSPERMLTLNTVRKSLRAFSAEERMLAAMLLQALGPIIDQHVARLEPSRLTLLSRRQLETLFALITQQSDVDEVVLRRLFVFFGVPNREALIAHFVHPGLFDELQDLIRIHQFEEAEADLL